MTLTANPRNVLAIQYLLTVSDFTKKEMKGWTDERLDAVYHTYRQAAIYKDLLNDDLISKLMPTL